MRKMLLCLTLVLSFNAFAEEKADCEKLRSEGATTEQLAGRGCCSYHGGACGCVYGQVQCCDYTTSGCSCHGDDPKEHKTESETPKS